MDHFQLTVFGEGLWVSREASSVPAVVAGELAGEIGRGLAGEWAQVLDTIWAIPWATGGDGLGPASGFPHGDTGLAEEVGGSGGG